MSDNIFILLAAAMLGVCLIVFLLIFLQIKTQNRILRQKRIIAENEILHQKELARILIVSQEDERKRIGMDLHDEVGTALSALRMLLEKINDRGAGQIETENPVKRSIDNIIKNVRRISHNLSPFTKGAYELKEALEDITERFAGSNNLEFFVNFNTVKDFNFLDERSQLAVYRIISELINNTIKHAAASRVSVNVSIMESILIINYHDNGIGIANASGAKKGIGMFNIESRCNSIGATYEIENNTKGFGITFKVPVIDYDKHSNS